jgi:hypothetical protein
LQQVFNYFFQFLLSDKTDTGKVLPKPVEPSPTRVFDDHAALVVEVLWALEKHLKTIAKVCPKKWKT